MTPQASATLLLTAAFEAWPIQEFTYFGSARSDGAGAKWRYRLEHPSRPDDNDASVGANTWSLKSPQAMLPIMELHQAETVGALYEI